MTQRTDDTTTKLLSNMRTAGRWPYLWILLISLTAGLSFQGSRGLFETTEGRYALCAKEMLQHGTWLEPTLLNQPHWTKPPLTYWFIAGGLKLFGINTWGARIPVAVAFIMTALLTGKLAETMWNEENAGQYAGLIYATSIFPVAVGFTVNTDTFLTFFETAAVLCYWSAWRTAGFRRTLWATFLWLALGLAFATKGPPGLMACIPMLVWGLLNHNMPVEKSAHILLFPTGWAIFLLIGGGWYLLEIWRHPELLSYFVGDEVIARVASDKFGRNPEWHAPFRIYLLIVLFGGGLWSFYLLPWIKQQQIWRIHFWRKALSGNKAPWLFLLTWLLLPLLIFSLSRSRLPNYLLPLYPALAVGLGKHLSQLAGAGKIRRRTIFIMAGSATLMCCLAKAGSAYLGESTRDMGALAKLCRPYDQPGKATFLLYERDDELGLDFYLKNPVKRVFQTVSNPLSEVTPEDIRQILQVSPRAQHIYLIGKRGRGREDMMFSRMQGTGIAADHRAANRFWTIVELRAATALKQTRHKTNG